MNPSHLVDATTSLIRKMHQGDPSCSHKIGDQVYKSLSENGDRHTVGESGVVTGSMAAFGKEAYLVKFSGTPVETFILGDKLTKL
jgi:hypothetical protein